MRSGMRSGEDPYKKNEEDEIVDALPMRREGESVDDYIARATRMLEQQAFSEM